MYSYDVGGKKIDSIPLFNERAVEGEKTLKSFSFNQKITPLQLYISEKYIFYVYYRNDEIAGNRQMPDTTVLHQQIYTVNNGRFVQQSKTDTIFRLASTNQQDDHPAWMMGKYVYDVCLNNNQSSICFDYELDATRDSLIFIRNGFQVYSKILCSVHTASDNSAALYCQALLEGIGHNPAPGEPVLTLTRRDDRIIISSPFVLNETGKHNKETIWKKAGQ